MDMAQFERLPQGVYNGAGAFGGVQRTLSDDALFQQGACGQVSFKRERFVQSRAREEAFLAAAGGNDRFYAV